MWPRHIHEYMLEFLVYVLTMSGLELVTLPTAEILSGKNARAWVSLYLKNK